MQWIGAPLGGIYPQPHPVLQLTRPEVLPASFVVADLSSRALLLGARLLEVCGRCRWCSRRWSRTRTGPLGALQAKSAPTPRRAETKNSSSLATSSFQKQKRTETSIFLNHVCLDPYIRLVARSAMIPAAFSLNHTRSHLLTNTAE